MLTQKEKKAQLAYSRNRQVKSSLIADRLKYITILSDEFKYRKSVDPLYSLRAFARDLKLDPIHLSRVLKNIYGIE